MPRKKWINIFALLLVAPMAQAEVPKILHYQGVLSDTAGNPVHCPSDGTCNDTYAMTFRLYDGSEGGFALFEQTEMAMAIHQGVFEVTLGKNMPIGLNVVAGGEVYLGLSINGGQELSPRLRVASSAFALRAEHALSASTADQASNADTVGGLGPEAFLTPAAAESLLDGKGYCEGPCYGDSNVEILLTEQGYTPFSGDYDELSNTPDLSGFCALPCYGDAQVQNYLTAQGYVPGPHYNNSDVAAYLEANGFQAGAPYSDAQVQAYLDLMGYESGPHYSDDQVAAYLTANGYVPGAHFSGNFSDLDGIPHALTKLGVSPEGELTYEGSPIVDASGNWTGEATGLQGPAGDDGEDGKDGVGVASALVDGNGQLVITLSNSNTTTSQSLIGPDGTPGEDGVSVSSVQVNATGQLVVKLSDDSEYTSLSLVGPPGKDGSNGNEGAPGKDGLVSLVATALEPAGDNCSTGGVRVNSGLDANQDNVLDGAEVSAFRFICNGATGQAGVDVVSAEVTVSGQLEVVLSDGTVTLSDSLVGPQGQPGQPGQDGALAGLACPEGQLVKMTEQGWACQPDQAGVGSFGCPADMVQVSDYCIEKVERPPVTWGAALSTCSSAGRRLCLAAEWTGACHGAPAGLNNMAGNDEWSAHHTSVSDGTPLALGTLSCTDLYAVNKTAVANFRCCSHLNGVAVAVDTTGASPGDVFTFDGLQAGWAALPTDQTLTAEQVDAIVADNGYATQAELAALNIPTGACQVGQAVTEIKADGTLVCGAVATGASAPGTVIFTRCPWVGNHAKDVKSCTPVPCPADWENLGLVANPMTNAEATGSTGGITSSSYTASHGYSERGCYSETPYTVLAVKCTWVGNHAKAIGTCTPGACPTGWTDQGVLQHVIQGGGATGSTGGITSSSYTMSLGYQARICLR